MISDIYSFLFSNHNPKSNIASRWWERELSINLSEEWENIYSYIYKGSINVSAQENGFKVFSRWYKTPLRLHNISPTIPPKCWRCSDEGSLLHIWWSCPSIQNFLERGPPPHYSKYHLPDRCHPSPNAPTPLHPKKKIIISLFLCSS